MPLVVGKKISLLILPFIVLLLIGIGSCDSEHDVSVSSYSQGKDIYIDGNENSVSRTPTLLKLKESAEIEVEGFGKHDVEKVLRDGVIFFTDSPLSIEKRFESYQYRQIIADSESNVLSFTEAEEHQERYVAYSYFWLGNLLEAKSILDELTSSDSDDLPPKHLKSLPRSDQAEVYMYLGYSNLNLGDESEARKNFIKAFEHNLYLAHNQNAFWDKELGNRIIEAAKRKVQMRSKHLPLHLFVVVDVSKSIEEGKIGQINNLQKAIRDRLKSTDRVLFRRFGEVTKILEFSNRSPSSVPIVKFEAIKAEWTDFSALFKKLHENIDAHKKDESSSERQMAILIISDGEHSVKNNPGGFEERIPEDVSKAIEDFEAFHKNIPIAIVILDRVTEDKAVKSGLKYKERWTEKLAGYCIGKSLYYESPAKEQEILEDIFDIITPARDKVLVMRHLEGTNQKNKRKFLNAHDRYKVRVEILSTLPEAKLYVKCSPNWTKDKKIQEQFTCIWEKMRNEGGRPLKINGPLKEPMYEPVEIAVTDPDIVFERTDLQEPKKITLAFYREPESEGEPEKPPFDIISLPFQKEKPKIQITSPFGKTFIQQSGETTPLKLLAEISNLAHSENIEGSDHPFKRPLHLTTEIAKPDYKLTEKIVSIPIDTSGDSGRNEFELTIKAGEVSSIIEKKGSNINIDFESVDDSGAYFIDDTAVGKMRFQILHPVFYWLYQFNLFIWAPLCAAIIYVFYRLDKKRFKTLRGKFKILSKFSECKWRRPICYILFFFFVVLLVLLFISRRSLSLGIAIPISSLILILLVWNIPKWALYIIGLPSVAFLMLASWFWLYFSLPNGYALVFLILILSGIFISVHKLAKNEGNKLSSSFRSTLIGFLPATTMDTLCIGIVRVIKDFICLYF